MNFPEPTIKMTNEKKLVGIHRPMNISEYNVFPLWSSFLQRRKEIANSVNTDLISMTVYKAGYFTNFNPATLFEKWITVEVANFDNVPNGMNTYTLQSGLYAVFHYKGINTNHDIFDYIFRTWLPNSKYELDDRPHFEVLGAKYKNNDFNSEEDIWVPIKPKN